MVVANHSSNWRDKSAQYTWSAPAERSGDGALDRSLSSNPKRCRATLATALQNNPVATRCRFCIVFQFEALKARDVFVGEFMSPFQGFDVFQFERYQGRCPWLFHLTPSAKEPEPSLTVGLLPRAFLRE